MNLSLEPTQYIVFLILIKLSLVTIVAAMLANFDYFAHIIFSEKRSRAQRYILGSIFCGTILIGVVLRYSAGYHALDFSIPIFFIAGLTVGFAPTMLAVAVMSTVFIFSGEYFMAVLSFISAIFGSILYKPDLFARKERLYDLSLWMLPVTIIALVFYRYAPEGWVFTLSNRTFEGDVLVAFSDVMGVFLTLFLWRHYKTKLELVESSHNLDKSRLAILSAKINPHFLFNTLNTIAAAIRLDQDLARSIVFKLSEILRYVLNTENEFKPLQDEINFIENYLSVENIRFGEDRLSVSINVDDAVREIEVPTMLIQPLVENAIKHGIAPLTDRKGELVINLSYENELGRKNKLEKILIISIKDNGLGTDSINNEALFSKGIGLPNVRDRLKLLYGDKAKMMFNSEYKKGTTVELRIPAVR
jgi:two-component system, LytTR family, sensor kinase